MKKKYYVGLMRGTQKRIVFSAPTDPVAADYPQYSSCVGPFRIKRNAQLHALFPSATPGTATTKRR